MAKKGKLSKAQAVKQVANRIVDVSTADEYLKVLLYGKNGKGKTRIAASAPKCLIVDINERGTRSVRSYKGTKLFRAEKWEDLTFVYWFLKMGNHPFKSVALDTLTMMQAMCIRHVLKEGEDRDPNRDPKTLSQREWGKVAEYMKPLLLDFRNLPMNVIFVAQERTVDNAEEETTERVPDLSPGSRATATACVEIIGRVYQKPVRKADKKKGKEKEEWETRMLVGPHDEYITKDRTGLLPRIVRKPNLTEILELANK